MSKNELTIKEAISQGYRYCGVGGQEALDDIKNISNEELKEIMETQKDNGDVYLAERCCSTEGFRCEEDVFELIVENLYDNMSEGFDCDEVFKVCNKHKGKIQKVLDEIHDDIIKEDATNTYPLTEIKLMPF